MLILEEFFMSERIIIFQKPTCSKCIATLTILKDSNEEFESINYYEVPLTGDQLREIRDKGLSMNEMLRSDEPLARSMNLSAKNLSDDELIELMVKYPDLIQRPIVIRGEQAVLCRPPENVLKLL
jgi:arsenate reductase (glutaredoxin)